MNHSKWKNLILMLVFISPQSVMATFGSMACADVFALKYTSTFMDIKQLDENVTTLDKSEMIKPAQAMRLDSLRLGEGRIVTYRFQPPKKGKPTVVLLNGLIYALGNWQEYFQALSKMGYGVLLVGYSTQPESIALLAPDEKPFFAFQKPSLGQTGEIMTQLTGLGDLRKLETQDLVDEVLALVEHLDIPNFHVVSLSYSSMVGQALAQQHSSQVESVIFMAPAVRPANRYHLYGESRHQFYFWQKQWNLNPYYDPDAAYDVELLASMYPIIYSQFAIDKSINVDFEDFFAGVFQKARSVKWFDLKDFASQEVPTPVHLFLAEHEDPPLLADQELFWDLMSENSLAGTRLLFEGSRHALPSDQPEQAALWTAKVIEGKVQGSHRVDQPKTEED